MKIAVIPARGGSKRIPRKNIRAFAGQPIISYSILAARAAALFDRIIVSTDDDEIAAVAREWGAETPFRRPPELSGDFVGTDDVVKHAIRWLHSAGQKVEFACCIYPTAPFIDSRHLRDGFELLQKSGKSYVFSVTSYGFPIQRSIRLNASGEIEPFDGRHFLTRSQDLEPYYHDAAQFYWGKSQAFLDDVVMFSGAASPLILPRYLVQDIDTQEDWERAEMMYESYVRSRPTVGAAGASGILITSAASKVPMLEAVRTAGRKIADSLTIVAGDTNAECVAAHFADRFWRMPPIRDLRVDELVDYCRDNGIRFIIPSRDGELDFFAASRETLERAGIAVMISGGDAVLSCRDKLRFAQTLRSSGFPAVETFARADEVRGGRIVVKERFGAGASGVQLDVDAETARRFGSHLEEPVYQRFLEGEEYSVDVYVDRSARCKGAIARRRNLVVDGESQVTTTERRPALEALCASAAETLGIRGHAVFQVIETPAKELHVIECNARFGGASTLSIAAGLDSFYWFLLEARGESLTQHPFLRSQTERRQIRYARDLVVDLAQPSTHEQMENP
jgi:carbamoyl-phosphate synthase large subunit